jgi:endonuclease/exonuclease/phosphatase family metal-dependent hydrolase
MTFNIWNYNRPWGERRALIVEIIERERPDVVALQETRHDWRFDRGRGQGEQIAQVTGYHPSWVLGHVYLPILRVDEGLTILTRGEPVRAVSRQLRMAWSDRDDQNQRVCIGVTIEENGRPFHVFDTHFSLSASARIRNAEDVIAFTGREAGDEPTILMGDLNAEPDSPPIALLTGDPSEGGGGFVDCWTSIHPDDVGYTYASDHGVRRIDYVLARHLPGPVAGAHLVGGDAVNSVYPSDHLGIVVDLAGG